MTYGGTDPSSLVENRSGRIDLSSIRLGTQDATSRHFTYRQSLHCHDNNPLTRCGKMKIFENPMR